ncbi:hypothetical protein Trydic_g10837 [Trypoxylus dichotomus]
MRPSTRSQRSRLRLRSSKTWFASFARAIPMMKLSKLNNLTITDDDEELITNTVQLTCHHRRNAPRDSQSKEKTGENKIVTHKTLKEHAKNEHFSFLGVIRESCLSQKDR